MNLRGIQLAVKRPCGVCNGTGEVSSEEWEGYRQSGRGVEAYFLEELGMTSVPPMKRECGNCDGGTVDGTMALHEIVAEISPQTIVPPAELSSTVRNLRTTLTNAAARSAGMRVQDDPTDLLRTVQEAAHALEDVQRLLPGGVT